MHGENRKGFVDTAVMLRQARSVRTYRLPGENEKRDAAPDGTGGGVLFGKRCSDLIVRTQHVNDLVLYQLFDIGAGGL